MHRSGTSAVTRTLSLVGAQLPAASSSGSRQHQGFWESADLLALHDRALESAGTSWEGFSPIPPRGTRRTSRGLPAGDPRRLRRDFAASPLFVVKDPRLCRLVLCDLGPRALRRRAGLPDLLPKPDRGRGLAQGEERLPPREVAPEWLRHVVDAERGSRGRHEPRLLRGVPRRRRAAVRRVGRELGLACPASRTTRTPQSRPSWIVGCATSSRPSTRCGNGSRS